MCKNLAANIIYNRNTWLCFLYYLKQGTTITQLNAEVVGWANKAKKGKKRERKSPIYQ